VDSSLSVLDELIDRLDNSDKWAESNQNYHSTFFAFELCYGL
jgi:ribosome assembly protein YihI (activator of Der GTPase)